MNPDWIPVKEAAEMLGYSQRYFREVFCNQAHPLVPIHNRYGKGLRRRVFVSLKAILSLMPKGMELDK